MIVTRFAPSPTGLLHLGHAASASFAHSYARRNGGKFFLRIEDIDRERSRPEFEKALIEDLQWLGLRWDGEIYRQNMQKEWHQRILHDLAERNYLYPCFCSRKDIESALSAPHGKEQKIYPGTCRSLTREEIQKRREENTIFSWRFDSQKASRDVGPIFFHDWEAGTQRVDPDILGDVVLGRKGGGLSYHLCSVLDDHRQGINRIIRGSDLLSATHVHRLLQALLGYEAPRYLHHPLICNEKGERLSKRDGAQSLRAYREKGFSALEILEHLPQFDLAHKG